MKTDSSTYPSSLGDITVFRIENASGAFVELSTLGAGILSVNVPDRNGKIGNVALRYANPVDYYADDACMGKSPGRYANRIAGGHLTIGGKTYNLEINAAPNSIHGGPIGFKPDMGCHASCRWSQDDLSFRRHGGVFSGSIGCQCHFQVE